MVVVVDLLLVLIDQQQAKTINQNRVLQRLSGIHLDQERGVIGGQLHGKCQSSDRLSRQEVSCDVPLLGRYRHRGK